VQTNLKYCDKLKNSQVSKKIKRKEVEEERKKKYMSLNNFVHSGKT
jgi:hypothetical protein